MRIDTSQQLRLEQQMKLSPRIIQAMEILQLPLMALQERIDQELEINPVLEMLPPSTEAPEPSAREDDTAVDRGERQLVVDEGNGNSEDFQRLAEFEDEYGPEFVRSDAPPPPRRPAPGERDRKLDAMANTQARSESLNEYLLEQWAFVEAGDEVQRAGRLIINHVDDDGYLRTPLEELAAKAKKPVSPAALAEALRLVQTLEPTGVGARDLRECLTIQLRAEADAGRDVELELQIVSRFLRDIELNRLPQVARKAGKTVDDVKHALENLSHLNPRPGSLIGDRPVPAITPDVIVHLTDGGEVVVTSSDGHAPRVGISRQYQKMARDRGVEKQARAFLRTNIRSAEWLMSAIQQRRHTIHRVAEEVFEIQKDFLTSGSQALKPLPMADVARKVGVHVATVSRAVAGKYAQTPQGIVPLRMFFSGGTTTAGGQDVAWDAVRIKLKDVIDAEDKSKPLNDDELAAELTKHGLTIARRTVAKYRGLMDIPPARQRKQF